MAKEMGPIVVDPGLLPGDPKRPLVRGRNSPLDAGQFLATAQCLARRLPDRPAALNLCDRRDNFALVFVALLMRQQLCLLPPSRVAAVIDEVMAEYPGSYKIDDSFVDHARAGAIDSVARSVVPDIPPDRVVAVAYTSGSTGRPVPNPKTWRAFAASAVLKASRIRDALSQSGAKTLPWIVATVPPQHMYGFELSVLVPLLADFGMHDGRPLYPADVSAALADVSVPRVLVSTPLHLRTLLESGVQLPDVGLVVSATAPLPKDVAASIEQQFGTVVLDLFGSTETCVIGSRRTASEISWTPYPGVILEPGEEGTRVDAPWFPAAVLLADVLDVARDGRFAVRGRSADIVEVAGKRASLADLTRRLTSIPGVTDAVVFQPNESGSAVVRRLAALVVAKGLSETALLARLSSEIDPAFLPRPLVLVSRLPRNEVGKLPRADLLSALKSRIRSIDSA